MIAALTRLLERHAAERLPDQHAQRLEQQQHDERREVDPAEVGRILRMADRPAASSGPRPSQKSAMKPLRVLMTLNATSQLRIAWMMIRMIKRPARSR
jgi:hypothetical protein